MRVPTPQPATSKARSWQEQLKDRKAPTVVVFVILLATTFTGYYSAWGVLFVYWSVLSLMSGEVFLIETIDRDENPVLFWAISIMWAGFGVLYFLADLYPETWQ